ncbi:MAG: DUF4038 domain-containing protein, partial [Armatimonadetes bacterium]|nr:DUF4038 domain-containing protein [Candidatus Hippobium faecium]
VKELVFLSEKKYENPYNVDVDVIFTDNRGSEIKVPCFWDGDNVFKCRFSSPKCGKFTFRSVCAEDDRGLDGVQGEIEIKNYKMNNYLLIHGPLKVSADKRHLCHEDDMPFLWLADTWWTGLTGKLSFDNGDFQMLCADRKNKGFNAVQMTVGLYPDMKPFDECSANEGGFSYIPYEDLSELDIYNQKNYELINPEFFKYADRKIKYLVDMGMVPVLFGMWGYFIDFLGVEKCKKFWRYIIARYAAYPVVFSYAGEATLMYYCSPIWLEWDKNDKHAVECWTEIAKYARSQEPFGRLWTIHCPTRDYKYTGKDTLSDYSLLDFNMMQSYHGGFEYKHTVKMLRYAADIEPKKPYLIGEAYFEGILEQTREEVQRIVFWASMMNGAFGYTYGANGIWQLNEEGNPFRNNPKGVHWGDTPWKEAMRFNGAVQLGKAREFLLDYDWEKFEVHGEWAVPNNENGVDKDEYAGNEPWAWGIPGSVRMFYFSLTHAPLVGLKAVKDIEDDRYTAY